MLDIKSLIKLPRQDHWAFKKKKICPFNFHANFHISSSSECVLDLSKLRDARTGFFEHCCNKCYLFLYVPWHEMLCTRTQVSVPTWPMCCYAKGAWCLILLMYLFLYLFRMIKWGSELHNNSVCTQLPVKYLV